MLPWAMRTDFDVVVIGTGSAAGSAAFACRKAGRSVVVIGHRPFGGTCTLRGCDPKKVLVGAADVVDARRRLDGRGVTGDTRIDWPALMRFKRTFTEPIPAAREKAYAAAGIEAIKARARFAGPASVQAGDR